MTYFIREVLSLLQKKTGCYLYLHVVLSYIPPIQSVIDYFLITSHCQVFFSLDSLYKHASADQTMRVVIITIIADCYHQDKGNGIIIESGK